MTTIKTIVVAMMDNQQGNISIEWNFNLRDIVNSAFKPTKV